MANILLVDDDPLLCKTVAAALQTEGHQVTQARDGAKALHEFTHARHDLVITDIFMPERDGLETIIAVRELEPAVPVIAMSGQSGDSTLYLHVAKKLGAQHILPKPFTLEELLGKTRMVLAAL
jgi:DNA-binding response OmpR family regulator